MVNATLKQKAGQSGSADSQPYLRDERLEIRVSPHEKKRIKQLSMERGFETMAHYVRSQAVHPGAESPNALREAQYACMSQLNKIGTNINQIARHLNTGANPDDAILYTLIQIMEHTERLVEQANATPAGGK